MVCGLSVIGTKEGNHCRNNGGNHGWNANIFFVWYEFWTRDFKQSKLVPVNGFCCCTGLILSGRSRVEVLTRRFFLQRACARFLRRDLPPQKCGDETLCGDFGPRLCTETVIRLFPTCQVRVVRFYQSCSPSPSPSPPPPLHPLPAPLLPLPCPLPPCQLFANFRTQWALLDLNCKGLSALGTAGPQPGTCRAQ